MSNIVAITPLAYKVLYLVAYIGQTSSHFLKVLGAHVLRTVPIHLFVVCHVTVVVLEGISAPIGKGLGIEILVVCDVVSSVLETIDRRGILPREPAMG